MHKSNLGLSTSIIIIELLGNVSISCTSHNCIDATSEKNNHCMLFSQYASHPFKTCNFPLAAHSGSVPLFQRENFEVHEKVTNVMAG